MTKQKNLLKDVSFILKDLLKVIKIVSIYPEDNPLPQSLKQSFAEKLVSIIENNGEIHIFVEKEQLNFKNEIVFTDTSKEDQLAGIFFNTGITDFSFTESFDVPDVYKLLDVIKRYLNSANKSLDLVAMIWESDIKGFTFATLEDIALSQYDGSFNVQAFMESEDSDKNRKTIFGTDHLDNYNLIFNPGYDSGEIEIENQSEPSENIPGKAGSYTAGRPGNSSSNGGVSEPSAGSFFFDENLDDNRLKTSEASFAMGFDDLPSSPLTPIPDTTLILNDAYQLSEEEEKNITELITEDAQFEVFESTLELLKEMLCQETELQPFSETVTICEKVLNEFVLNGKLIEAGHLLQYLKELENELRKTNPLWAERLKEVYITASSRDRLKTLAEALNNNPAISTGELRRYLDNFNWVALSGLTDLMGDIKNDSHRETLCNYLTKKGQDNLEIISKGIFDKRWYVVANSITILSQIGDDKALGYLKRIVNHEDDRVRMELVRALKNCPNDKALETLTQTVSDKDRKIRAEAIEAITSRRGRPAFDAITEIINEEVFYELEHDDQCLLLKTFSILGGELAVSFLSKFILRINLFHDSTQTHYRAIAFEALSHNRSEKGEKLLVKLTNNWRPDIRKQANEALKKHREIKFGEK